MTPQPADDPTSRADDRPTSDEATSVPEPTAAGEPTSGPAPTDPAPTDPEPTDREPADPEPADRAAISRAQRPTDPLAAALDGYFWERRRRRALLPIAVGVVGLTALGLVQELPLRHAVERDLADRSAQALAAAGVQGVNVQVEGRDATVTGRVGSRAERDSAISAVRRVRGMRVAHDRLSGPWPAAGPSTTPSGSATTTRPGPAGSATSSATSSATGTATVAPQAAPQLTVDLHGGRLTLVGMVPSAQARADVIAAARAAVDAQRVSSRIGVDPTLSGDGLGALAGVLRAVGPDAAVTVELRDGRITLTGEVASQRQLRQAVAAGAAVTGDPAMVTARLTVDPRVAVAAALRALPPVTFRTAYSTPTRADEIVIRRLAGVLRAHPEVRIQVQGHTDDVGDTDMNHGLSYARARTVYLELVRLGVPRSQLSFRAFGEQDPKLPNTTADNRAANRRVEFAVQR